MDVIVRLVMFAVAVLLVADVLSPERTEQLHVDGHAASSRWDRVATTYRLSFVGGRVDNCNVGYSVYDALRDGDAVEVDTTRVFKSCDGIRRGDEVIRRHATTPWFSLALAAFLLAGAFGWFDWRGRGNDDEDRWRLN